MSSKRSLVRAVLVCGVAVAVAFVIGESLGQRSMAKQAGIQLKGIQAMLLTSRIVEERELKSLLARGCATDAIAALSNTENADLKSLKELVDGQLDPATIESLTKQAPHILEDLETFKGTYVNPWPGCTK